MGNVQNNDFDYQLDVCVDLLENLQKPCNSKISKRKQCKEKSPLKDNPGDRLLRAIEFPSNSSAIPFGGESSVLDLKLLLQENRLIEYKHLPAESFKFKKIEKLFPRNLEILYIDQVFNPFIKLSFQLKQHFIYSDVTPMELFHGTKMKHVHSICSYNFDWRYNGVERGHIWGKGVNFTPSPKFALNFCDSKTEEKVIILADVLVINKTIGNKNLNVPPEGYDTTTRGDNKTFVKFCDAEFCPQYVIYFRKRKP